MKKEIKFRAFDDGKMIYEKDINHLSMEDNLVLRLAKFWSNIRNDSHVMQYTGLIDKNGKDIYEGDIIKRRFHHNNPPSKRPKQSYIDVNLPVTFSDGSFHTDDYKVRMTEYGTTYGMWYRECEVIGNIYQNPDLLSTSLEQGDNNPYNGVD